jgi:phosphoribosylaminoimidazolecarboxamide formyltransferase/IMP cyclohydrolase
MIALTRAWEGDPVSAFGGVLVFTDPVEPEVAEWLAGHFVELVAAPELSSKNHTALQILTSKRKNLKAVPIRKFGGVPNESMTVVPGGRLYQTVDLGNDEVIKSVTQSEWPQAKESLARFGIAVCRSLKSNAIAIVRELHSPVGAFQLVGAGQGQPNRIEALKSLAVPRAQATLRASEGKIEECIMVSDAFFPFRDTVDAAYTSGIRLIIQPGGSIKDGESITACNEHGIAMAFTGTRHFKH